MIINHNISSLFAARQEGLNNQSLQASTAKLSSGEKINKAGDDAAGLAISEKMRSQIRGLNQASRNIGDAVSFVQVAEGYLQSTTDVLQRIRELSVQASNGVFSDEDRLQISVEISQLVMEVDRIASSAQFNGLNLLTGRFARDSEQVMRFQVGANVDQNIQAYIGTMTSMALGLVGAQGNDDNKISVSTVDEANMTLATVDNALTMVNKQRAELGAFQNRMEIAQKGINIAAENLQSSESKIRDTDFARETVEFAKNQILQETSLAMLSQSQIHRDSVLNLLR